MLKLLLVIALGLIGLSTSALAQTKVSLDFLYPGGEASAAEAAPVLSALFDQLGALTGYQFSGVYRNEGQEIQATLKNKKAELVFASLDLLDDASQNYEIFLHTLSSATKKPFQQFHLVTHQLAKPPFRQLVIERPLAQNFLNKNILAKCLPHELAELTIQSDQNILTRLKNILPESGALILLNDFQYFSMKKLKSAWAQELKLFCSSENLASDPVLVRKDLSPELRKKLGQALMALADTESGCELLGTLRLAGFKWP